MVVDFGLAAMTSPAATTPLSKVSPSRMAAALFSSASSSPLASCSSSSSASPGAFQAVFSRADSGFSSAVSSFCSPAFPALRSSFLGNSDSSLLQQERRSGELLPRVRAPSISPLFSCALSTTTTNIFGGLSFRSNFNSVGGRSADRRSNMSTTTNASSASAPAAANTIHDFTVKDINGDEVNLSKFKGKVLLVVNVASACGLTSGNYTELAEVYSQLKDSGFEILAFPCNQFGGQEPGTNAQIKEFACTRYKAEYPLFDKVDVNGPNTAPVYQFLKAKKGGGILGDSIKWNFGKFLINKDGIVVERYAPTTTPKKIVGDIKKLLNQ